MSKKTLILHVFYNQFFREPLRYGVTVVDSKSREVIDEYDLKRTPRAAKYDEVYECGCGAKSINHLGWCTKQQRVYKHHLEKA